MGYDRGQNTNRDILNRWTSDNPHGTMPALIDGNMDPDSYIVLGGLGVYQNLDMWVKKQNYMRVQSIRLGYELPFDLIKKVGITQASVALEARNLFVFFSINPYCNPNNSSHSGTTSPMEHSKTGMHAKLKAHIVRRLSSRGIIPMRRFLEITTAAIL